MKNVMHVLNIKKCDFKKHRKKYIFQDGHKFIFQQFSICVSLIRNTIFVFVLRKYSNLHFNVNKRTCFDLTGRSCFAQFKRTIKSIKGGGGARSAMLAGFELQR